ncbi:DNA polymerase III subunit psi [Serratia odorifera]|uniref:DNA polymerase III subunit psi n=1 Tax=Serratia odorifera TaxID=618 RepID=A0A3S4DUE6_SEROD|nr:DNA polymerase III subunit psi [Serratia odorifera]VDZ52970.1 DNA polymerase III subunit psi [Serratia odorifera]
MASQRDWLLQQLGITQWTLPPPRGCCKAKWRSICRRKLDWWWWLLPCQRPAIRCFCDVLRSLGLTPAQAYCLTPEQAAMLPDDSECNSWRLGITEPLVLAGAQLSSPALAELS